MTRTIRPRLEVLEGRTTPAAWQDVPNLTLSLIPDGTDILGRQSRLFELLGPDTETWQRELLRAFQTWAVHANLNVGLVDDLGLPGGVTGLPQGDPRFGAIRIGAVPMSDDVLAVASQPDVLAGTWAGDLFLNSNKTFSVGGVGGPDLFSVVLHEAGHAFGLDHVDDPTSAMAELYAGVRGPALGASDVVRIQELYGPRPADTWEGLAGNDTVLTAADLTRASSPGASAVLAAVADVAPSGDVDFYRFQTTGNTTTVRVTLRTAGLSLLSGRVAIYDADGRELAATGGDPGADLILDLPDARNRTLYVRVSGDSADVFGVGGYHLSVDLGSTTDPPPATGGRTAEALPPASHPPALLGSNERLRAVRLTPNLRGPTRPGYRLRAEFTGADARALYVLKAPTAESLADQPRTLTVTLRALEWPAWQPRVVVYDARGNLLPFEVIVFGDGTATVRLDGVVPNRDYYLLVQGDTGEFFLGADFGLAPTEMETLAVGRTDATTEFPLAVERNALMHLLLEADGPCRATFLNAAGEIVYTLETAEARSGQVFLPAGNYVVRVAGVGAGAYRLRGVRLSDPIGPELEAPLAMPAPTGGTTSTTTPTTSTDTGWVDFLQSLDVTALPSWGDVGTTTPTGSDTTSLALSPVALPEADTIFMPIWDGVWLAPLVEADVSEPLGDDAPWTEEFAVLEPSEPTSVPDATAEEPATAEVDELFLGSWLVASEPTFTLLEEPGLMTLGEVSPANE
jgi:hypothetical protein